MESELDSVRLEVLRGAHILPQVRSAIGPLIEEIDLELLKEREGNVRKNDVQVSTTTFEPEPSEARECDARPSARHDRRTPQLLLNKVRRMGIKIDSEYLQPRHE
jgi:hypothetical protein